MTKMALIVLAACVDVRSGNRFSRGDEFSPPPNYEQAKRLIAAGCLPPEALDAVVGPMSDAELALEDRAKRDREDAERRAEATRGRKEKPTKAGRPVKRDREDDLDGKSVDELKAIADAEQIEVGETSEAVPIIEAIRAARAAKG